MTTRYLDPLGGSDAADGASVGTAWKSLYWATAAGNSAKLASGDSLLIKCDSLWSISGNYKYLALVGLSGVTISTYGSGAAPVCEYNQDMPSALMSAGEIAGAPLTINNKWYEVDPTDGVTPVSGTRLWRINFAAYTLGFAYVTFGVENLIGFRGPYWYRVTDLGPLTINAAYLPQAPGEWDAREGASAADPAAFICWAPDALGPVHYYGRIRWQSAQEPVIRVQDCTGVVVDGLACVRSSALVRMVHPGAPSIGHAVRNCVATDSGGLVIFNGGGYGSANWADGFRITGNRIVRAHTVPIYMTDNLRGGAVEANYMEDCGLIRSDGGVYFANCYAPANQPIHVRRNVGIRQRYGKYYLWDGRVIMADSDSANIWIYGNYANGCRQAFGSNSGVSGIRVWGNISEWCDHGWVESDLLNFSGAGSGRSPSDTIVANNSFLRCGLRQHYTPDGKSPESTLFVQHDAPQRDGAIQLGAAAVDSGAHTRLINNVVTGDGSEWARAAFGVTVQTTSDGHYTAQHNCFYGFANVLGRQGVVQSPDATNITSDPLLSYCMPTSSSPLVGAGTDWWTADGKASFGGAPGAPVPAHIGAVMPVASVMP